MIGKRIRDRVATAMTRPEGAETTETTETTVEAVRAVILDGAHLWLTLDAPASGTITARAGGQTHTLGTITGAGNQTVCLDLSALPQEGAYALALRDERSPGAAARRIVLADQPDVPTRAPLSPDGRWRYRVVAGDSALTVRKRPAPEARPVTAVGVAGGLEVAWTAPAPEDLHVLDEDGTPLLTVASTYAPPTAVAVIDGTSDLPAGARLPLASGPASAPVPLIRSRNDLRRPHRAVVMPAIDLGGRRVELGWASDGRIEVRTAKDPV